MNYTWSFSINILTPKTWEFESTIESNNIIGDAKISTSVGASRTASFSMKLAGSNPSALVGKGVSIIYTDSLENSRTLFTGIIRSPSISYKHNIVTFLCSDNFKDRLSVTKIKYPTNAPGVYVEYQSPDLAVSRKKIVQGTEYDIVIDYANPIYSDIFDIFVGENALYSPYVFGDIATHNTTELFDAYLSTTLKDIAVDGSAVLYLVSLDTQQVGDTQVFNETNIIYSDEPVQSDISTNTSAPVNKIICKVPYRFPSLTQRNYLYTYAHPGPVGPRGSLALGTNWATKAAFESAIESTGLHLINATYTDMPASQVYTDALGNQSFWIADEKLRKDFVYTANFSLASRFVNAITHTLVSNVKCPASIAKAGSVTRTETAAVDVKYDTNEWTQKLKAPFLSSGTGQYSLHKTDIAGYTQADANNAMAVLVARAKREILKSHSKVGGGIGSTHTIMTTLRNAPSIVGGRASISLPNFSAAGLITDIVYSLSMTSGPTASITISSQKLPTTVLVDEAPITIDNVDIPLEDAGITDNGGPFVHDLPIYISGVDTYPGDTAEGHFTNSATPAAGFPNEIRIIYNEVDEASQSAIETINVVDIDFTIIED